MASVEGRCAVSYITKSRHGADGVPSASTRVRPRKSLGQHFLTDRRILSRISSAADLTPEDLVLEIGPGLGALTRMLVERAGQVVAVEMDQDLASALPSRLNHPPNLTTVHGDARTIDLEPLVGSGAAYKVVANLPFYAANPIVRRFLEAEPRPKLLVVMVQQEVAHAMLAKPGKMTILSVATQFYAEPVLICSVPPRYFRPQPKVTSSVVRLNIRPQPAVPVREDGAFFALVRAGFTAPRKQLRNSLSQGLGIPSVQVSHLLADSELDGTRRAETLSLNEWALIHRSWEELSKVGSSGLR